MLRSVLLRSYALNKSKKSKRHVKKKRPAFALKKRIASAVRRKRRKLLQLKTRKEPRERRAQSRSKKSLSKRLRR